MQVKWETNMQGHAMHVKAHMQWNAMQWGTYAGAMQCIAKVYKL